MLFAIAAAPLLVVGVEHLRRAALAPARRQPRCPVFAAIAGGAFADRALQLYWLRTEARPVTALTSLAGRMDHLIDAVGSSCASHGIHGNVAMLFEWAPHAIAKPLDLVRVFITDGAASMRSTRCR